MARLVSFAKGSMLAPATTSKAHSIRTAIFGAFVAMGLITGAVGAYGLYVLFAAGKLVVQTYDGPLMAINFARSASLSFSRMDKELLRRAIAPAEEHAEIDKLIGELSSIFLDDLGVAEQRALAPNERVVIAEIKQLFADWNAHRLAGGDPVTDDELLRLSNKLVERFDVLTELIAGHTFVERRKTIWAINDYEYYSLGALAFALVLSAVIAFLLARRILRPLSAAAVVADRIAAGELNIPIPMGSKDEMGALLRSMSFMQQSIRMMMEREMAQRRSAQNRLIDALESSQEGMALVDAEGKIVIANSQIARFFPTVAPYLVEGADFSAVLDLIHLRIADKRLVGSDNVVGELLAAGEHELDDGRWVRFSHSETQDGGSFLFLSDFTDIKQREEHFKQAKRAAEEASMAKTNFLANMSHELRTPLNAVIGFSEIISGQILGDVGNQKYVGYAQDILQSGRHLLDIINSVLDLAKSDAGKLQLMPEMVDLRKVLDSSATMIREQCRAAELGFDVAYPDMPLLVMGEAAKLRQIVLNLLSNAVKFTKPGGSLSVTAREAEDNRLEIRVTDTGIGIAAADIPTALAPFGQIDSSLSRRYEGTGLGLPLTKVLVELHGGKLDIISEPGIGTTVLVALPRAASKPSIVVPLVCAAG
jgi:signal transduction histidine kinase/HAMP domain-containing protein